MSYILGSNSISNKQIKIALIQIFGIGPKKAIQLCYRLGLSENIRVNKLTSYQIDEILKIMSQNYLVDSELKTVIQRDIKRLISIGCYRGFRHNAGLPLRGQRTHTNAKTCRRFQNVSINPRS
uniref:Small ribosomal subunit protein uS13m n=1 Tax=Leiosporoceros dussii TaxID=263836 RepID=A0A385KE83_9EMBR|nr:ribosomal protein S13 [Leiosporoceros dussii]AXZ70973.1 ribosomal protein S13 [Leiosporoceros dussii]